LKSRLLEAGINRPGAALAYLAVSGLLAAVLAWICLLSVPYHILPLRVAALAAIPLAIVGGGLPHVWLEHRRAHRQLVLRRAMPDFLDLIVACLGGGLSIQAALRQVADELRLAHPDLSAELNITLRELELGSTLDRALQQMANRNGVEEMKTLRSFIQQTIKFGTTITDALTQMSEMLRIQREQRAEELAQKAAVKILFPTMLFIFPTTFVVLAGPAAVEISEGLSANKNSSSGFTGK
jgi:tight adherence protein C